jgi:hypothetical protein
MRFDRVRRFALSLPEAAEAPHFERTSFRVKGKIFATGSADGRSLNVFVPETEIRASVADDPITFHELRWGSRLVGLTVELARVKPDVVFELVTESWLERAPKRLVSEFEATRPRRKGTKGPRTVT